MIPVNLDSPRIRWLVFFVAITPAISILFLLLYNLSVLSDGIRRGEVSRKIIIERQQIIISKLDSLISRGDASHE